MEDRHNIGETSAEHRQKDGDAPAEHPDIDGVEMNITQRKIAKLLKADPHLTGAALAEQIGITRRNIEFNIRKMKEIGVLVRHGSSMGGYWEVRI